MTPDRLLNAVTTPIWIAAAAVLLTAAVVLVASTARRRGQPRGADAFGRRLLVGLAIATAVEVAVVGGVRSFEAVSVRFGSPLVPLTADGMIVACTALRIAALTRGWRIPGALATTYGFIVGTVWLNVAAAHSWSDAIAHALAPLSYAVLVEMLAHLLRLHLHLATPGYRPRVAALAWATSPVVTTRVWLHLARTGTADPVEARALVQQLIRIASRLRAVCPSGRPWPFGQARHARAAGLQVVRDGLLTARQLAELLPSDGGRLAPAVLLARVDQAALGCTAPASTGAPEAPSAETPEAPSTETPEAPSVKAPQAGAPKAAATSVTDAPAAGRGGEQRRTRRVRGGGGGSPQRSSAGPADGRSDAEMVAELHRVGGPMAVRKIQRLLGVGWPRAKRLADMAGWTEPTAHQVAVTGHPVNGRQPPEPDDAETVPADQPEPRTKP